MNSKHPHKTCSALLFLALVLQGCATPGTTTAPESAAPAAAPASMEDRLGAAITNTADAGNQSLVEFHHHDGIVLLTGQVSSEEEKARISNAAAFAAGSELRRLSNELRVVEQIDASIASSDAELETAANALLAGSPPPLDGAVLAIVENASVFLVGRVSRAQGAAAAQLVSGLQGVAAVKVVFDYAD